MGGQARQVNSTGFYHVVFRGINHQYIFEEVCDYTCFLQILRDVKSDLAVLYSLKPNQSRTGNKAGGLFFQ